LTRYFVTAWCDRPFFAQCEVEAETPEKALALAREAIHDAPAEECDDNYSWDEWRVDTAEADGLLLELDDSARLKASAPRLLASLLTCSNLLADYDDSDGEKGDAYREAVAAIRKATVRCA
jgi:hypothetical protein